MRVRESETERKEEEEKEEREFTSGNSRQDKSWQRPDYEDGLHEAVFVITSLWPVGRPVKRNIVLQ